MRGPRGLNDAAVYTAGHREQLKEMGVEEGTTKGGGGNH